MLIKEAIQKVAKELKNEKEIEIQDPIILDGYSEDLTEQDIRNAMMAISVVSEVLFDLQ
tara:strand:+ start:18770 stop:18946 length:177 start_codon:yes stop_codon:yes gene_type:complete